MSSLQVRELPDNIYCQLQTEAKKKHRSIAQQAVVTLQKGLGIVEDPKIRRQRALQAISEKRVVDGNMEMPDPVKLIRDDRIR